jgi:glycosyltransferase involved in cell wall biosynthesis
MVTPSYHPIVGGAESVVRNLSTSLNRIGVTTDVMTFNMDHKWYPRWQGKTEKIDDVNILKIPGLNWFPATHSDRFTQRINLIPGKFRNCFKNYDIVHFHVGDLSFPLFSLGSRTPKLAHFHGPIEFCIRDFVSRLIIKNMAHLYIAISQPMIKELITIGLPRNIIRYLPNSVDTCLFHPSKDKEENLVLFVARITFGKGLHVLLESLKDIKTRISLVIIGPPDYDYAYFQEMQKRIYFENKKGFHTVTYIGEQKEDSIAKWCQKASILVLPSFKEASSIASLEALSCATPVIATNVGGIPEIVRNGENGILIPPNNVTQLVHAIQFLLDNKDKRVSLGLRGRQLVEQNFSYSVTVKRLVRIYEELC